MISFIQFIIYNLVVFLSMLFAADVDIVVNAPDEVEAGSTFVVEITITKNTIKGFARLNQDYPVGYLVTPKYSAYGDLTFKEQKLKIIWQNNLPNDSSFTISYFVQVDPTTEGLLEIGGTFSYLINGEIKTAIIPAKKILIVPQGQLADINNVDTTQVVNEDINSLSDPTKTLCFRQITKDGNDYIVNLLVQKGDIGNDKFAKIQEKIPADYNAQYIETKGSIFSFKENNVKLLWMAIPPEEQFIVSYRLTPVSQDITPVLSGTFSYIQNETTKVIPIKDVDFLDSQLLANGNNVIINKDTTNQNNNQNNNNLTDNNQNNNNYNQDISPESGIYYKVQIAAARQVTVNPKYYFRQFNVSENVQLEMHEGWRKYTVGKFKIYKDARDHRINIWQSTPIKDAFVSAYNNGTRITVQEALMIANQKWVQ